MPKNLLIIFFLFLITSGTAQTFSGAGGAIPDAGPAVCFPINVSGVGNIDGTYGLASVCINVSHPFDADLEIILKAPDGTAVQLSMQNGGTGANYAGTCFTASASMPISSGVSPFNGSFLPQGYLGNINNGQNADGLWYLCIQDVSSQDIGSLTNWSLNFSNSPAPPPPGCSANPPAGNTCATATAVCNLNGFCGNTSATYTADTWPQLTAAFCGIIENNSFISFTASSASVSLNVWVTNSLQGLGIQMMIFGGGCGSGPVTSYACNSQILPSSIGPTQLTASGLTAGNTYYIMIDGYNGDVCDYTLVAASGVNVLNISASSTSICSGRSVALTASGGNGVYTWSPNERISSLTGTTVTVSPDSTKVYSVTSTPFGNCPLKSDITITVRPKPDLGPDKIVRICPSGSIDLNNQFITTGLTKAWTTGGIPVANPTFINTAGVYKLIVTNSAGCSDTALLTLTVDLKPNLGPDKNTYVCQGFTKDLTPEYNTTGLVTNWTFSSLPFVSPAAASVPGVYQLIASGGTSCSDTALLTLVEVARPVLGPDKQYNLCTAGIINLNNQFVTTGLTTSWTYNGLPPTSLTSAANGGDYELIATDGYGCSDTAIFRIVPVRKPNLGPDKDVHICTGVFVDLTLQFVTTGNTTVWTFGAAPVPNPANVTSPGTYKLVASSGPACDDSALVKIILDAKLDLGADKVKNICPGATVSLPLEYNTSSLTTSWTLGGNPVILPIYASVPGVYQLIATNGSNCADTALVTIVLKPKPALGPDKGSGICQNSTFDLTTQFVATGLGVSWWGPVGPSAIPVSLPGAVSVQGVYRLIATNAFNCSDTALFTLQVNPKPYLGADTAQRICPGQVLDLTAVYPPQFTGTWTLAGNSVPVPAGATTAGTYQFITGLANGCSDTSLLTLTVNPKPSLGGDKSVTICPGSSVGLSAQYNTTGLATSWSFGGTPVPSPNSIVLSGNYQLVATNAAGCSDTSLVAVTINPKPALGIDKKINICSGGQVDLTTEYSTAGLSSGWTSGGVPVANPSSVSTGGIYQLIATNSTGCSDTAFLTVLINPKPDLGADKPVSLCTGESANLYLVFDTTGLSSLWTKAGIPVAMPQTVNSGGAYQLIVTSAQGCKDTATANIGVNPRPVLGPDTTAYICPGTTVNLNAFFNTTGLAVDWTKSGIPVSNPATTGVAGLYQLIGTNSFGCADTAFAEIIMNATSASTTSKAICPGQLPYTWNSIVCNTGGTFTATLINAAGCDSVATLQLTVKSNSTSFDTLQICPAQLPYSWNGIICNAAGSYSTTVANFAGCDSVLHMELMVKLNSNHFDTLSICPGQLPYSWNSVICNAAGSYTSTLVNAAGCDSIVHLELQVKQNSSSLKRDSICPSNLPYSWNGNNYAGAGTYTVLFANSVGCDSVATLELFVKSNSIYFDTAQICPGQLPYSWNAVVCNAAGAYTATLMNAAGCDSIVRLELIVHANSVYFDTIQICPGQLPYSWNSITCNTAGTYTSTLSNAAGCDSVVHLELIVNANSVYFDTIQICPNQLPYSWNSITCNAAGSYTSTLVNAAGCDSLVHLELLVKRTSSSIKRDSICPSNLPYSWNGNNYAGAGTYTALFTNSVGCDSVATLELFVKSNSAHFDTIRICPSQLPYSWNTLVCNAAGAYTATLVNAAGCDSIVHVELIVNPNSTYFDTVQICPGQLPYTWNSIVCNTGGAYSITLVNAAGCDSVVRLELIVNANSVYFDTIQICPGQLPYSWNSITCNTAGTYTTTLMNAAGCDSVIHLELIVNANSVYFDTIQICPNQLPYSWNSITCNAAGSYTSTLVNAAGCDSLVHLELLVKRTSSSIKRDSICPSNLPYSWNGNNYAGAGTYTVLFTNSVGCDSVATLELFVKSNSAHFDTIRICPSQLPYSWNTLVCNAAGAYTATLVNAAGCDSIVHVELIVNPNSTYFDTIQICPGQLPYTWNSIVCNTDGAYSITLANAAGCDSIVHLALIVHANSTYFDTVQICSGQLPYSWNGIICIAAGPYTTTLINAAGCDSLVHLELIVNPSNTSFDTIRICSRQLPYSWHSVVCNAAGLFTATLVNRVGCDSVIHLKLIVDPNSTYFDTIQICPAQLPYSWNGIVCVAAGPYIATLTNAAGCDSIVHLQLLVKSNTSSITNLSICTNELPYSWNGISIAGPGGFTARLTNAAGCDSVATLHLIVNPNPQVPFLGNDTLICPGEKVVLYAGSYAGYLWQDFSALPSFTAVATGRYHVQVTNDNGCKAAAGISVNVLPNCDDIYFPNAFSPNADGKNDYFGALGNLFTVSNYKLQVFNRYGTVVFASSNPYQKWDGKYMGQPIISNTGFIWTASYLFRGVSKKTQKGTLTLLR